MTYEDAKLCADILKTRLEVNVAASCAYKESPWTVLTICDKYGELLFTNYTTSSVTAYPTLSLPDDALVEVMNMFSKGLTLYKISYKGMSVYRTVPSFSCPTELNMRLDLSQLSP